ncbi:DUF87 domain-containing protein [Lacrimispora amygdalina]|uniref:DUF87 domain-containing protein n=1 Tax=Lacrimispora amygdalina TaxID=253257 RepID=A0A3E2ND34_9FIRM|nr:DUF87 domain-containing protein [Clostridium indicum]RFZ78801.1 DUF87 domain-containing protein [Clostridium indicum]
MMDKQIIPLVYDEDMLKLQHSIYIHWDITSNPHMAIQGVTGMGKTYLVKEILARIGLYLPTSEITLCDFKGDDFTFLKNCGRYYRFESCMAGFDSFYDSFLHRQAGPDFSRNLHLLMFDEWGSFLNYLDKKQAEEYRKKLSIILMMGRSFNYHVLLAQQRLSAEDFPKVRDNFNTIITLGNPSKEVIGMFFNDFREEIKNDRGMGSGYVLSNGTDFRKIVVPTATNIKKIDFYIKRAVEYNT